MVAKVKFHFNPEFTDYTSDLGGLCPDKYSHEPAVGDTVTCRGKFLGVSIENGIIVRMMPKTKRLKLIYKKLDGFDGLDPEDHQYLDEQFEHVESEPFSGARAVVVELKEKVADSFVNKHLGVLGDLSAGCELMDGTFCGTIRGTLDGGYYLIVELKCFIDGRSVVSTKQMDAFKAMHAKKTCVENVAWSDRALPLALIDELNASLDRVCKDEPADYHPGSGKVVRDIVHPSMYCYVKGVSQVLGVSGSPCSSFPDSVPVRSLDKDFWGRDYEESVYQWLPAEFFVSEQGTVQIKSYINNLDRRKYPGLYSLIERMFEKTLPLFEAVCGSLRNDFYGLDSADRGRKSITLKNRTLQVVTKIVEYRVNREENFDGVWHVEGMSHEEVLATALCVVKRDENFSGAEIEFRRFLFAEEGDALISSTPQNAIRPTDTMGGGDIRPLGRLKTPSNRLIVFPNSHIHRLSSMHSADGKDAIRRIVVFWLVNPEKPIISTANVMQQQGVMTKDEAQRNRLALMAERKLQKESFEDREVGLCEH